MQIGQFVAHKRSNEGIGIILQRDTDTITAKFESGSIITSTPELIIELNEREAGAVRLDSKNIRTVNKQIKKLKFKRTDKPGIIRQEDAWAMLRLNYKINKLRGVAKKDYDFLKTTFDIDYKIEK